MVKNVIRSMRAFESPDFGAEDMRLWRISSLNLGTTCVCVLSSVLRSSTFVKDVTTTKQRMMLIRKNGMKMNIKSFPSGEHNDFNVAALAGRGRMVVDGVGNAGSFRVVEVDIVSISA